MRKSWLLIGLCMLPGLLTAAPMTSKQVQRIVISMEALVDEFGAGSPAQIAAGMPNMLAGGNRERIEALVKARGFDSFPAWQAVSRRVIQAYSAHQLGQQRRRGETLVETMMAQMPPGESLSPEQRASIEAVLTEHADAIERLVQASQEDVPAIRPHLDRIARVVTMPQGER